MIRSIILSFAFLLVSQLGSAQKDIYISTSFHEPADEGLRFIYSKDGYHWDSIPGTWLKPLVGKQKVMRDPSIVRSPDGVFHLVWTSSWKGDLGFGYAHSKDLIHWSEPKLIPVMKDEPATVNVWAPEIFYDDVKNRFVVVWASCIPNHFPRGIEDVDNNHRLYYITTKDFEKISAPKVIYDPGFSSIDATITKRGKGDYVMVFKDNTRPNRNIKVAFAKTPVGPYSKASEAFTDGYCEGPTVEKVDSDYLIYYDAYRKFAFGAARTRDFIHFEDISNKVSVPKNHKHGTIFRAPLSMVEALKTTYALRQKEEKDSLAKNACKK